MTEDYQRIELGAIRPSPYQPRKTFPEAELAELAASIKTRGVLQPVRVRPDPGGKPAVYELVFGERRWRASKLAGVEDIPALIVDLTDDQVIEEQLIENLKRSDVQPLEEGEHYQRLLHQHGYTIETLVTKTGRSRSYLYSRMKLTSLTPTVRKALGEGKLVVAIAELLGRIADPKLQERACKEVLGRGDSSLDLDYDVGVQYETIDAGGSGSGSGQEIQPLSVRAAAQLLRRRYMLRLELAKFNPHDAGLTKIGACTACPHRSSNQPELPGVNGKADDLCTNPPCFEEKTKAAWEKTAKIARDSGMGVVAGKAAAELFDARDELLPTAAYVDPKAELPANLARPGAKATWGKLLGKQLADVPLVVVQDPTGAPRELLDRDAAVKILRDLGKIEKASSSKPSKPKSGAGTSGPNEREDERKLEEDAMRIALGSVAEAAAKDPGKKELAWWRWMVRCLISVVNYGDADLVSERRGLSNFDDLAAAVDKLKTSGEVRGVLVEILICVESNNYGAEQKARFAEGLKLFGVDWDKALAAAKAINKKICGATDGAAGPPCFHKPGHKDQHSNGQRTWNDKKSAKKGGGK